MKKIKEYSEFLNESVRDKMTPIDATEIDKKICDLFEKSRKDGSDIDSEFYYNVWLECAEKYNIFDNYYVYKDNVYFIYDETNEYGEGGNFKLVPTFESSSKFKEKLENAIKKINTLS